MSGEPALGVALLNFHRDLGCDGLLNVKHPVAVAAAKLVDGSLVELSDHAAHGSQCVLFVKDYYNDRHACKRYFGLLGAVLVDPQTVREDNGWHLGRPQRTPPCGSAGMSPVFLA